MKAKIKNRSPFEILTKHVEELEKERKAIIAEKEALETKLEAALDRIQTLTKELEEAKCQNIKRKRDEDGSDSALLSDGTSVDRKRKKKRKHNPKKLINELSETGTEYKRKLKTQE